MTNLEAIKASVNIPVPSAMAELALTDREVTSSATYAGKNEAFELAKADLLIMMATSANISEGGYSVSISNPQALIDIANRIYETYGVESPMKRTVKNASDKW